MIKRARSKNKTTPKGDEEVQPKRLYLFRNDRRRKIEFTYELVSGYLEYLRLRRYKNKLKKSSEYFEMVVMLINNLDPENLTDADRKSFEKLTEKRPNANSKETLYQQYIDARNKTKQREQRAIINALVAELAKESGLYIENPTHRKRVQREIALKAGTILYNAFKNPQELRKPKTNHYHSFEEWCLNCAEAINSKIINPQTTRR